MCMQELLETHMNMRLPEMQELAEQSAEEGHKHCLPGAQLPEKGFYYLRTPQPSQQQQKPQPYWRRLSSVLTRSQTFSQNSLSGVSGNSAGASNSPDGGLADLQQPSGTVEVPEGVADSSSNYG